MSQKEPENDPIPQTICGILERALENDAKAYREIVEKFGDLISGLDGEVFNFSSRTWLVFEESVQLLVDLETEEQKRAKNAESRESESDSELESNAPEESLETSVASSLLQTVIRLLIPACLKGHPDAWRVLMVLIKSYGWPPIHAMLKRQAELAEDAYQKTCFTILVKLKTFDLSRSFRVWVSTIARRKAIDEIRNHKPTLNSDGQERATTDPPIDDDPERMTRVFPRFSKVVDEIILDERKKAIYLRHRRDGMSMPNVAKEFKTDYIPVWRIVKKYDPLVFRKCLNDFPDDFPDDF